MEQKTEIKNLNATNLDIELMKSWCNSLSDSSKSKSDDFDKFLKMIFDIVLELSNKNFFKREPLDEGENYFISNLGPSIITNILSEKMNDSSCRTTARDILEIFIKEFATNMENSKLNPIWEAIGKCFNDTKTFFTNLEAHDIGDRFWV